MKITIRQKLFLSAFIILMCNGVAVYLVYKSNQRLVNSEYWVHHTEQAIYQSANIRSLGQDIETASRGYVITCDTTFLEPLHNAKKTIFTYIGQLKQLTSDNYAQQQRIDSLDIYMRQLMNFSFKTVELRNKQGLVAAIAYTTTKQELNTILIMSAILLMLFSSRKAICLKYENKLMCKTWQLSTDFQESCLLWWECLPFFVFDRNSQIFVSKKRRRRSVQGN